MPRPSFADLSPEQRRDIARKGGAAPHRRRGFNSMTPEQRAEAARKGGIASGVARREHKDA